MIRQRCAIYTRKSTEEGLEQDFNSLDAQREACAAYILSQKHEGWAELSGCYDDGGFSGGSMERPSLKALLGDVQAGRVDVIVVYKVDRLTRSLADFAKIVDVFDAAGVSFVSVRKDPKISRTHRSACEKLDPDDALVAYYIHSTWTHSVSHHTRPTTRDTLQTRPNPFEPLRPVPSLPPRRNAHTCPRTRARTHPPTHPHTPH